MAETILQDFRCWRCKLLKPVSEAHKHYSDKYRCDECHTAVTKQAYEKYKACKRRHYRKHKDEYLARCSKRKARKLGGGGSHSAEAWRQLLALFGGKCLCCGRTERITRDHVIPITRGGSDNITNLQPLCWWCNKSKFTANVDYRTREKVALPELNEVGKLLFSEGELTAEQTVRLEKHKPASRFTGVNYYAKSPRSVKVWIARIQVNHQSIRLGGFATEEEAALAYNKAARELIGPDAFQNAV